MRSLIHSLTTYARQRYWQVRGVCGLPPRGKSEIHYRILRSTGNSRALAMPWGQVEFTNNLVLAAQYSEIFIKRHYACSLDHPHPVIVDCGGNIGMSALWFYQNYPGCSLTVYEADEDLAGVIKRNLKHAGIDSVTVLNKAVWSSHTTLSFDVKGDDSGKISASGSRKIEAVDLAAVLPERVDLLKMDIEGAEFEVLEHLLRTGAIQRVRNLVVEFHPSRSTMGRMLRILDEIGQAGFKLNFDAQLATWLGLEADSSPFEVIGRKRTFLYLSAWRSPTGAAT